MSPDPLGRDDVANALDALAADVPASNADPQALIARGRHRVVRQRVAIIGVAALVIVTAAGVGAAANHSDARRVVGPVPTSTTTTGLPAVGGPADNVAIASELEAWKCLNPLQYTDNGGQTWRAVALPDPGLQLEGCTALAGGNLWAVSTNFKSGTASVLRVRHGTADVLPFSAFRKGQRLSLPTFVDADHGWVETYAESAPTPEARLYRTSDGGVSWKLVSTDPALGQLAFVDPEHGWTMTGNDLRATSDGGETWTPEELPEPSGPPNQRIDTFRMQAQDDWIVVWRGVRSSGARYHPFFDFSTDGGRTWLMRAGPDDFELPAAENNAFDAISGRDWVLTSENSVRVIVDAGEWRTRPDIPGVRFVMSVTFPTRDVGWVTSDTGAILRTTDGGFTWTDVTDGAAAPTTTTTTTIPTAVAAPAPFAFTSETEGWICSEQPSYSKHDFALTPGYTSVSIPPAAPFQLDDPSPQQTLCASAPGGNLWLVRGSESESESEIVRITSGGLETSVVPFRSVPFGRIQAIDFVDADHGWALVHIDNSTRSDLYGTNDGGLTWSVVFDHAPIAGDLVFTSTQHGWASWSGEAPRLATTTDGGRTWQAVDVGAKQDGLLTSVSPVLADGDVIVAYGLTVTGNFMYSFFEVSTDGGKTWGHRDGPNDLRLAGTYPSDFDAADADHWAIGTANLLDITDDGGKTWTQLKPLEGIESIWHVARPSATAIFVSGIADPTGKSAVVLGSTDAGRDLEDDQLPLNRTGVSEAAHACLSHAGSLF